MIAWKILRKIDGKIVSAYDKSVWEVGVERKVAPPDKRCIGLNASRNILNAMDYTTGEVIAKVSCGGKIIKSSDKFTCEKMTILQVWDFVSIKTLEQNYLSKRQLLYYNYAKQLKPLYDTYLKDRQLQYDTYLKNNQLQYDVYQEKCKPLESTYLAKRNLLESTYLAKRKQLDVKYHKLIIKLLCGTNDGYITKTP